MMEGNEKVNLCSKTVGWLQRQDKDAEPWLWKLSNCFSAVDQALPAAGETPVRSPPTDNYFFTLTLMK